MTSGVETRLTVVVIMYNMRREAARTLYALTPRYQLGVRHDDYEVHVIDNGSDKPLDPAFVASFGSNFRYSFFETATPSPCAAINHGASVASTPWLMVMIDGARIPSPGIVRATLDGMALCGNAFVYTIGMHLGSQIQREAMLHGYDQTAEDRLLESVPWQTNGYRLFDVSVPGGSCRRGFVGRIAESNAFCMVRQQFLDLGGFDSRFVSRGGGLANPEFFNRAHRAPGITPVLLLGEATFHQFHGGAATNVPATDDSGAQERNEEYSKIVGEPFQTAWRQPLFFGRPGAPSYHLFPQLPDIPIDSPVLFVLGMHRSGTSCLAGMLQFAGFEAGTVEKWNSDNQRGNRENPDVMKLNDAVLRHNQSDWEHPPITRFLAMEEGLREARTDVLKSFAAPKRPWMFKDPRTVFTMPFWREAIPNPRRIGIFRHPLRVAMSLYYRSKKPIVDGLALWLSYNKALLAEYERAPFPIISFDVLPDAFLDNASKALQAECGDLIAQGFLEPAKMRKFYAEELVHHRNGESLLNELLDSGNASLLAEIRELHSRLCRLAGTGEQSGQEAVDSLDSLVTFNKLLDADSAASAGDFEKAAALYRELTISAANPRSIWVRLVRLLQEKGRMTEALQAGEEAMRLLPTDAELLLLVAGLKAKSGSRTEALDLLGRVLEVMPNSWLAWMRKGECLCDESKWEDGALALKQAIELSPPGHFWANTRLGQALIRSGNRKDGDISFERALGLAPETNRAIVCHVWAQSLVAAGDLKAALPRQQMAASMGQNMPHIQAALSRLLNRLGSSVDG